MSRISGSDFRTPSSTHPSQFADKSVDQKKTIGSRRARRPVLANSYPRPSALIRGQNLLARVAKRLRRRIANSVLVSSSLTARSKIKFSRGCSRKNADQKKTIGSQRAQRPVLANSYPRPSALIRGLKPSRARRQAAKAPDCKSGTREFESHRALQNHSAADVRG